MKGITVKRTGDWLSVWLEEPGARTKVLDVYVDDPLLARPEGVTRRLADMKESQASDGELAD
ncbi:MAG: hypothetical protein M3133_04510 [Actinomycetota bacterium]|nr:hypothetical protein [Actinomycetota bacterium]